jgi:hypothetical protein
VKQADYDYAALYTCCEERHSVRQMTLRFSTGLVSRRRAQGTKAKRGDVFGAESIGNGWWRLKIENFSTPNRRDRASPCVAPLTNDSGAELLRRR